MDDLSALYRDIILEHAERSFDRSLLHNPNAKTIYNRSCGDAVSIVIQDGHVMLYASGCSICKASASMLADYATYNIAITSNVVQTIKVIIAKGVLTEQFKDSDIAALAGVAQFPNRIKCALLPLEALEMVLNEKR